MGTWGSGNLDSDGALDYVAERSTTLIASVWSRMRSQESWEADESEHDALFVELEVMFALEAAGLFNGWDLPEPEALDPVRTTWLAGWDEYYPGLEPTPEFMAERRGVITTSFDRFGEICAKYHAAKNG